MEILIGILIGIAIAVVVVAVVAAIWYFTRDVRASVIETFEVTPHYVCFGELCPIRVRFSVSEVGEDQQVWIAFGSNDIAVEPVGELSIPPNEVNFPEGPGAKSFVLRVEGPPGRKKIFSDGRSVTVMDADEPRAFVSYSVQTPDPMGRLLGTAAFLGDSETEVAARSPESILRLCKNSKLVALSLGDWRLRNTDFTVIPSDSQFESAAVTVNQLNAYELRPGEVVDLQEPLPIGDGIQLEASVPPPQGTVDEWPANSFVQWFITLHVTCPE